MRDRAGISMTDEELDAKVFEIIRSGKTRAGAVLAHLNMSDITHRAARSIGDRDVNKSLQRLRRRGLIEYGAASRETAFFGWRVVA